MDCFLRLRKFDPDKSSRSTFVHRIVQHRVATLVDAQRAACRDYQRCRESLDDPSESGDSESISLGENVSNDDYEARIGRHERSSGERAEIQIDVSRVTATLPPELAAIAMLLTSMGATEAALHLQLPRATLYRRIADIRRSFEMAGLNLYLNRLGPVEGRRQRER